MLHRGRLRSRLTIHRNPAYIVTRGRIHTNVSRGFVSHARTISMEQPLDKVSTRKPTLSNNREAQQLRYEPLNAFKNEIRLLLVHPASRPDEPIRCQMIQTSLNSAPPYQALSYSWGDKNSSHQILVNQGSVQVTTNLKQALQRLRPRPGEEDLIIWVDAICINQQDIPERNIQTGKMRKIYRNAESVCVWIGLENQGSSGAIKLAHDVSSSSEEEAIQILKDPTRKQDLQSLVHLFRRHYWWRIWVIQEISCGKETTMYCGNDSISWISLQKFADIMTKERDFLHAIYYKHLSKAWTLTQGGPRGLQLSRYSSGQTPPLLELLLSHKSKNSTDPKDKVYALVGLCSTRNEFGDFNYSSSMRAVYSHTARHIISTTQQLDVICVRQHDTNQFGLPSWVPDWTRASGTFGQSIIGLHHHEPRFSAAGESIASVAFSEDGYILKAQGIIVDRIKALGIPFKKRGPPADVFSAIQAYNQWKTMFFGFKADNMASQIEFGKVISCGNWVDDENMYETRLKPISKLSDRQVLGGTLDSSIHSDFGAEDDSRIEFIANTTIPDDNPSQMAAILSATLTMNRRKLFISASNGSGLAPWDAEVGDLVCVLLGCRFPVVLRPWDGHYVLVGEAYANGFMDGEALNGLEAGENKLETFDIH